MRPIWCLALFAMLVGGCAAVVADPSPAIDVIACEAAVVTLIDAPQPAPQPDPGDQTGATYGGPLDMLRDARELIRKGNDLADRGKTILDAAEREGKVTIDVRLPGTSVRDDCPDGRCPTIPPPTSVPVAQTGTTYDCSGGVCRRGLFGRLRR